MLNKSFLFYLLVTALILQPIIYEYYNIKIYKEKEKIIQLRDNYTNIIIKNSELERQLSDKFDIDSLIRYAQLHNMELKINPTNP